VKQTGSDIPIFKVGDVVRVPFPYVDTPVLEVRPALIISVQPLGPKGDLFWAAMITSATNRGWPGDVSLETDHARYGLPIPSVVRTEKIAVFEFEKASHVGRISPEILKEVQNRAASFLGLFEPD
jgi:mRNA interferase MazF